MGCNLKTPRWSLLEVTGWESNIKVTELKRLPKRTGLSSLQQRYEGVTWSWSQRPRKRVFN